MNKEQQLQKESDLYLEAKQKDFELWCKDPVAYQENEKREQEKI